jgi:hypothetical protein
MELEPRRTSSTAASSAGPRLVPAKHVVCAVHGTRTVLLDPRRGRFYGLDEVGGRVWSLVSDRLSVPEIVERLVDEYDVDRDRLESDVQSLLTDLQSRSLLEAT